MNYKELILSQVENHFRKAELKSLKLEYFVETELIQLKGLKLNGREIEIKLTLTENLTIRKMLINKITKLIGEDYKSFICVLDLGEKTINTYKRLRDDRLIKVNLFDHEM